MPNSAIAFSPLSQYRYRLVLPNQEIDTGEGDEHLHQCLQSLALMPVVTAEQTPDEKLARGSK